MVDVLLLAREHGPGEVELAVRGALDRGRASTGTRSRCSPAVVTRTVPRELDDLPQRLQGLGAPPPTLGHYDELLDGGRAMSAPAQVQAMQTLIEAHAVELKLPTVGGRFRTLAEEATRDQQTPTAYLAALLEAEVSERAERRERRRLIDARFPLMKRLEDFRFEENPKIPQATIAALAQGTWIDDRESVILLGDSGTGKTHLAIALAVLPANKDDESASPPSPRSRTNCKQPRADRELQPSHRALRPNRARHPR